jgi:hypothetical protein
MNLPYHLNEYKLKVDTLSSQAKSILEFCISNREIGKFYSRINQECKLNADSVQVLKNRKLLCQDLKGACSNKMNLINRILKD